MEPKNTKMPSMRPAAAAAVLMLAFVLLAAGFVWQLGEGIRLADSQPPLYKPFWLDFAQGAGLPLCAAGFVAAVVAGLVLLRRPRLRRAVLAGCGVLALLLTAVLAAGALAEPVQNRRIDITIPAGSSRTVVYADIAVCPVQSTVYLWPGDGLGDTEAVLQPEKGGENLSTYITPGVRMGLAVEAGEWYRVGITAQNDTGHEVTVSVMLRGVRLRGE